MPLSRILSTVGSSLARKQILRSLWGDDPPDYPGQTFVDATPTVHPVTGQTVPKVRITDPLWNWEVQLR